MSNSSRQTTQQQRQRSTTSGVEGRSRDVRRMAGYIGQKVFRRPGGWADNREEEYLERPHPPSQQKTSRNQIRATNWRKKASKVADSTDVKDPTLK